MTSAGKPLEEIHAAQASRAAAWGAIFTWAIVAGLILVVARVVQLKVAPDTRLAAAAGTTWSSRSELARRGSMYDRRGRVLALSTVGTRLFVDPGTTQDPATVAVDIASATRLDPAVLDEALSRRLHQRPDTRYVVLCDLLEGWQADAIRQARIPGVGLEPRQVRHYPNGPLGRAVVGLVGFEHSGLGGFEHRFEDRLQQEPGQVVYQRDSRRRPMWINPAGYTPAASGNDVHLSIDLAIQEMAERHLGDAVERYRAAGGRLVVMDCRTGELLALADRSRTAGTGPDPAAPLTSRCATQPYEPGSSFKPFIWATATALGRVRLEEVLPTPADGLHRTRQGRLIHDSTAAGNADWCTVLIKSLNSGMAIAAERLSFAEMQEAIARFGFGKRTGCRIPGESPGIVTPPQEWSQYTQTSVAMGHEIAVTPLQMVRAFSAFARDGTVPALRVTAARRDDPSCCPNRVLDEAIARTTRSALRRVVEGDPLKRAWSERCVLFGKSGTAQLPIAEGGGYHQDRYVSSFIAGAPYESPRLVVLCVIEDPDRSIGHFGSTVAGPAVRGVMEEALEYLP
jgi:cell division protein FtsI/penicillin-binding protein 2